MSGKEAFTHSCDSIDSWLKPDFCGKQMKLLFWILLLFVFYTYFGYPLFLYLLSLFYVKPIRKAKNGFFPPVSVVIAARNEEANIERRIENILDQDYPKDKLELIIVSDGSTDKTEAIVVRMIEENEAQDLQAYCPLKLIRNGKSRGKPFSINQGVLISEGEVVVFADCRQRFSQDAIKELINNFIDENVGCVSGELVFESTIGSSIQTEMGAYWNFEKWLRKLESATGSVPGATGAIYAVRKCLFRPFPVQTLLDDVLLPMHICMQGYRTIFESKAIAFDRISMNLDLEKKRKIRTLAGNWQLLFLEPLLLNPAKNPIWIRFVSHKILRLIIPYCLLMLLIVAFILKDIYSCIFLATVVLFFLISILPSTRGYFLLSNITRIFRSIIFLNFFAFLAPFKLALNYKKLW